MTEGIESAAPVTESAPPPAIPESSAPAPESPSPSTSSRDLVAEVVKAAEAPPKEKEPPPPPTPEPELSRAAKFLISQGHKIGKREDGRTDLSYLPASTVEKFLDKYVEEHRSEWNGARGTLESQLKEAREAVNGYLAAVRGDPTAFLSEIAQHDPRYRAFLDPQAAPAPQPAPADDPMPAPDLDFGDGRKTYSIDGLQKLLDWKTRQVEARFEEKLKPLAEREKEAQQRAQAEQAQQQLVARTRSQIETAKTWPNWAEWEGDILKTLQEDSAKAQAENRRPEMSLREAYLEVKAHYLGADDSAKRQRWMEEQNKAPRSTSIAKPGIEQTRQPGPRPSREVVAEAVARLESQSR